MYLLLYLEMLVVREWTISYDLPAIFEMIVLYLSLLISHA